MAKNWKLARDGAREYVDGSGRRCYVSSSGAVRLGRRVRLVTHVAYVGPVGGDTGRFKIDRIETVTAADFQRVYSLTGAWFTPWGQELVRHDGGVR